MARNTIAIYTPDLEPALYEQGAFLDLIKNFMLSQRFSKVRVLLVDPAHVLPDSNPFAALGRRLPNHISIRHVTGVTPQRACAYMIVDDQTIVYRLRADTWDGIADFNNPAVARLYLDEFDSLWNASTPERMQWAALQT